MKRNTCSYPSSEVNRPSAAVAELPGNIASGEVMNRCSLDLGVLSDVSWWHWALTIPLLGLGVSGHGWALAAAVALCLGASIYFYSLLRSIGPYPVQVRIAYLGLLVIGAAPGMGWVHWIQLLGTTAMVTVGYCPLLRMLGLLPFNRQGRLTMTAVWDAFFRQPCVGGLLSFSGESQLEGASCCSIRPRLNTGSNDVC